MRTRSLWRPNSRRLTLLLLIVAVPPAATLIWLGVQLLAQERSLVAQRDLELRQVAMPAVRPDGKRIVFHTGGGASAKVWALENVLPAQPPTK